jgi:hypothetical protein
MSISSVFSLESGLVLPGAAASRSYAVARTEPSIDAAQSSELVAAPSSGVAARFATRSLGIEDFSALVAEAEVRARTLELFGNGSNGESATTSASSHWVAQNEEPGFDDWLLFDSPAASSFAGIEERTDAADTNSALLTDPADENGDGYLSLTEELAYARTHSLESTVFERDALS